MDALGSWLLKKYIGEYVEGNSSKILTSCSEIGLDSHSFKFVKNNITLTDLVLKRSILDELELPIIVQHGIISTLSSTYFCIGAIGVLHLQIPDIFDLGAKPVIATLKNLNILAKLAKVELVPPHLNHPLLTHEKENQADIIERLRRTKQRLLNIASLFAPELEVICYFWHTTISSRS